MTTPHPHAFLRAALLLLTSLSLVSCSDIMGDSPSQDSLLLAERIGGLWVQDTIEWSLGTAGDSSLAWSSSLLSVAFHRDGHLSVQTRGVDHIGRDSVAFSAIADRVGYSGRWWTVDSSTVGVEYRMTYSDIEGGSQRMTAARRDTLRLDRAKLVGLDVAAATGTREYRLQRPRNLTRETVRVLTWRDSLR
jgi:hypothetical protein